MFIRTTEFAVDLQKRDEGVRITNEVIGPGLRNLPGFDHMYVGINAESGSAVVITVWESEEAERASRADAGKWFGATASTMTGPPADANSYKIVYSN